MIGPAERAAAAAGIDGPHERADIAVELHALDTGQWRVIVMDDRTGVELGRVAITPDMLASLRTPSRLMLRLMRAAQ